MIILRNSSSGELSVPPTENVIPNSLPEEPKSGKKEETKTPLPPKTENKPLLTKSSICRLLAELVKSYGSCAKQICEHTYEAGISEIIKDDTTALAFILDELLISKNDKEMGNLVKTLIAALASCNQFSEAQSILVGEVKSALARALAFPESSVKHSKVQALTTLISTMIESCPAQNNGQMGSMAGYKNQYNMNNMVKLMLKRGIISDLARVSHSLDLCSPNVAATLNASLKPLEMLTRIVNQPTAVTTSRGGISAEGKKDEEDSTHHNNTGRY